MSQTPSTRRRVVILSRGGSFFTRVMAELDARGVRPTAVLLYPERSGGRLPAPLRRLRARVRLWRLARGLRARVQTVVTGPLNGARMMEALRRLAPDVVVLAGCGMLARDGIEVAREGTANVHPGLLPWVRGNSPLAHSLLRGVPLGATAFRVDAGIDTGPVLARRLVPVRGGEARADLDAATTALWVEMTADAVASALADVLPAGSPQRERFPLCRTVADPDELAAVDAAVRSGAAKTLFDRWRPLCDPARLTLPADADAGPVPHADA
jgi:methionyl-tRNA formyltransferase